MITSTELWAMKSILSLHSRTGNVLHAFINQLSHTCPLQEENIPLFPLTFCPHLQPAFYYPYSLLLLLVNRELENSVSMVMWAW